MSASSRRPNAVAPPDRRFISLFSGAGGLDLGLAMAGWQEVAAIEMDGDAIGTLELAARRREKVGDVPESLVLQERIEAVDPRVLRRRLGLRQGQLPLLAGGPPCQPFTTHGLRRSITDARASGVWPAYLGFVSEFRPRALLVENVDGLLSAALRHRPLAQRGSARLASDPDERKGSFLLWLLRELVGRGYSVTWGLVEAADYGVPQFRQRTILIGVRGATAPCYLPAPQFGRHGQPPFRTLRDALATVTETGAVQPLSQRKRSVYEQIPAGGNWRSLPEPVQAATMGRARLAPGGKSGWWRRLAWDAPAPTILGMPDHSSTALVHPEETRCLSVTECAAAQSFPPEAEFAGNARSTYQQIGNAVPPLMARAVGERLAEHLAGLEHPRPDPPAWRKTSANRRIGTHGWVLAPSRRKPRLTLNAKVRPDHVWADADVEEMLVSGDSGSV